MKSNTTLLPQKTATSVPEAGKGNKDSTNSSTKTLVDKPDDVSVAVSASGDAVEEPVEASKETIKK